MQLKIWSAETGQCAATLIGHTAGKISRDRVMRETWSSGYKTFFMLNSAETKIYPSHKC